MASSFEIGKRAVGGGAPTFIIAEVAQAHDGSLGLAHAFIDAAHEAGVDAIKFQTHIAAAESTLDEPFRVKFSRQDETRYAYWRRMEFTAEGWAGLAKHAGERGLVFLSSPFSLAAVELLAGIGMPAWKVASGELASASMLSAMVAAGGPFLVSSGMSSYDDIARIANMLAAIPRAFALFQCTSSYPTPLENVGLNVIGELRTRFAVPVGLSDHSGRTEPAMAAMARGADAIEVHLTLDRRMFGPDVSSSLTVAEMKRLVEFRDALATMDASPVDKDEAARAMQPMRSLFGRSLAPARALAAGTVLAADMLTAKKPGTGIPETQLGKLVGRRLVRDVAADRLISWTDMEGNDGET